MCATAVAPPWLRAHEPLALTVYKDADCSCCDPWVAHLRAYEFAVEVITEPSYTALQVRKDQLRVPAAMRSCHTAVLRIPADPVGPQQYLIEGHVPAAAIQRLLRERPRFAGLAVPGMPSGTPGMELPPNAPESEPYAVVGFDANGDVQPFGRYPALRRSSPR